MAGAGVVVVTGAARGIGRGIAERMVARGHLVVITDVDATAVALTAGEIGAAAHVAQDVRDPASHRAVAEVALGLGRLVAWFNNAGVGYDGDLTALTDDQVRALVEVNLLGVLWGTRAAIAIFGPEGGDIVNTASLSAHGPVPGLSVYAATKAAVVSVTTSVNAELPARVRVHALCPDGVDTQMVDDMDDAGTAKALVHSGGRILTVAEAADAAVGLVGSRRVVRTVPVWRGALSRSTALTPGVAGRALPLFTRVGRRVIARRSAAR
ncbi:MAG: SDR family oxidoreductase [Nocardioidaceae bacterium]